MRKTRNYMDMFKIQSILPQFFPIRMEMGLFGKGEELNSKFLCSAEAV